MYIAFGKQATLCFPTWPGDGATHVTAAARSLHKLVGLFSICGTKAEALHWCARPRSTLAKQQGKHRKYVFDKFVLCVTFRECDAELSGSSVCVFHNEEKGAGGEG